MKKVVKFLIIALAVVMVFGVCSTAFAYEYGGPSLGFEWNYFDGTISNSYYTVPPRTVIKEWPDWIRFQEYMYVHQLASDGTPVAYTSRLYTYNNHYQASNMIDRPALNNEPIITNYNSTYINQYGIEMCLKVDNTYYRYNPIEFGGKWYTGTVAKLG